MSDAFGGWDSLPDWALEEHEELKRERDLWHNRTKFWSAALLAQAERHSLDKPQGAEQALVEIFEHYILVGLESGDFFPDVVLTQSPAEAFPQLNPDDAADAYAEMTKVIPFSVVTQIAEQIGFDAVAMIEDYIEEGRRNLSYAASLIQGQSQHFALVPMPPEMVEQVFKQQYKDSYILHVVHDDHPCQHPYDSLEIAVEAAAIDEQSGHIQSAHNITYHDEVVLDVQELRQRIDQIKAAGLN